MRLLGSFAMILGGLLLLWPGFQPDPDPQPEEDIVSQAFDEYERLWRHARIRTAEALEEGLLTEAQQTRDFEGEANKAARVQAMTPLAEKEESSYLNWDPAAHAKLLREYQ